MNMVRLGNIIYGMNPSGGLLELPFAIKAALSLESELVHVKKIASQQGVGYGKTYVSQEEEYIGTLPLGYADGWTRDMQENDLVPTMNAVENIFVGNELGKGGLVDFQAQEEKVNALTEQYQVHINPLQTIEKMSVSDQQFVKILKSLSGKPRIIIMDEPTSMFNIEDAGKVLDLVRNINKQGIGIIYISHYLEEVQKIADRVTVIRDGSVVNTYLNEDHAISLDTITCDMVGRPVDTFYTKEHNEIGDVMLEVKGLKLAKDGPEISFSVRKGEILGFSGMVGSGRRLSGPFPARMSAMQAIFISAA